MRGCWAAVLECFQDCRRNCKLIWKGSSFYSCFCFLGGGGGRGGWVNYKMKTLFILPLIGLLNGMRWFDEVCWQNRGVFIFRSSVFGLRFIGSPQINYCIVLYNILFSIPYATVLLSSSMSGGELFERIQQRGDSPFTERGQSGHQGYSLI